MFADQLLQNPGEIWGLCGKAVKSRRVARRKLDIAFDFHSEITSRWRRPDANRRWVGKR
jgi:hypothetical protein